MARHRGARRRRRPCPAQRSPSPGVGTFLHGPLTVPPPAAWSGRQGVIDARSAPVRPIMASRAACKRPRPARRQPVSRSSARPAHSAQGPPAIPPATPAQFPDPRSRGGTHRYPRPCAEFSERRVASEIRLERGAARRQPECRAPETLERVESMRGIKRSLLRRSFSGGCRPTIPELPSNYPRVAVQPLLDCRPTTLWATACSPETSSKSALPVVVRRIVGPVRGRCVRPPRNSVRTAEP